MSLAKTASVLLKASGVDGVVVLVIGNAEETLIQCELEFDSGNATRGGTYAVRPMRPRPMVRVGIRILILEYDCSRMLV